MKFRSFEGDEVIISAGNRDRFRVVCNVNLRITRRGKRLIVLGKDEVFGWNVAFSISPQA